MKRDKTREQNFTNILLSVINNGNTAQHLFHLYIIHTYIYIYISLSSYDETIQRKQSAQYRKRRAITVKVTLTSARCDTVKVSQRAEVSVTLTIYHLYI